MKINNYKLQMKLIFSLLLFTAIMTITLTTLEMYRRYNEGIQELHRTFERLRDFHLPSLAQNLWRFDENSINLQMRSMMNDKSIICVEVSDDLGGLRRIGNNISEGEVIRAQYPIVNKENSQITEPLGIFTIYGTDKNLRQGMKDQLPFIILSELARTVTEAFFLLFLFYSLFGRHLNRIISFTDNISLDNLNLKLQLHRRKNQKSPDELDRLTSAMNDMAKRIYEDITDRKLAEESLRKSEEQFRALAESSLDTIMRFDREYKHIYVNKMAAMQTGIPVDKFIGKTHEELIFPKELIDISNNTLEQVFKTGEVQRVEFRLPTGTWVDWLCVPEFGTDGKVQYVITTARDITERKIAQAALESSEQKFRELFNDAPVGYHEINESGQIVKINNTELKMLGYEKSEMINHYIWDFIVEKERCRDIITEKLMGKKAENNSYELTVRRKNGSIFSGLLEDVLLYENSGKVIGIRSTVQDITVQKHHEIALHETNIQLEQALTELKETQKMVLQQERMRSLGQMASGIAHDINNSLSPIIGFADLLLRDQNMEEKNRSRITLIKTAGLDIVKTIERMKEFYRPRVEQDEFQSSDLNMIITSTIDLTRHKWKDMAEQQGKVIQIRTNLNEKQPKIWGHENEIREALTNLIINASDAMPEGGLITINCFPDNDNTIIEIIDEGFGMNEETLNRCLDPFYTTKGESGTGLGLSMVYGIMQRHQGNIKIESEVGKGTTIRLSFPVNISFPTRQMKNIDGIISGLKILCIDDNINLREMIISMLQENKHSTVFASSGKMGLQIFQDEFQKGLPFDLVITDLGMPYMDGKSVADSIKSRFPEIPIILMTGWGAFIDKNSIKNVEYILKKPLTIDEINEAINQAMKR